MGEALRVTLHIPFASKSGAGQKPCRLPSTRFPLKSHPLLVSRHPSGQGRSLLGIPRLKSPSPRFPCWDALSLPSQSPGTALRARCSSLRGFPLSRVPGNLLPPGLHFSSPRPWPLPRHGERVKTEGRQEHMARRARPGAWEEGASSGRLCQVAVPWWLLVLAWSLQPPAAPVPVRPPRQERMLVGEIQKQE